MCVELGAPQVSRLGPLLSQLYTNDSREVVRESEISLFVDDRLVCSSEGEVKVGLAKINLNLETRIYLAAVK